MADVFVTPSAANVEGDLVGPGYGVGVMRQGYDTQRLTISSSQASTTAMPEGVRLVRIRAEGPCWVTAGANPTASGVSWPMGGDPTNNPNAISVEMVGINEGDKIAIIERTA